MRELSYLLDSLSLFHMKHNEVRRKSGNQVCAQDNHNSFHGFYSIGNTILRYYIYYIFKM